MKYFFEKTENISLKSKMVMKSVFLIFFIVLIFVGCSNHDSSAGNQSQTVNATNTPAASITQLPAVTQKPKVTETPTSSINSQAILSQNKKTENIIKSKMNANDYSYFEFAAHDGYVSKVNINGYNLYNIDTATIGG